MIDIAICSGRAEVRFAYDPTLVSFIKAQGGFRWDPKTRCWYTYDIPKAHLFKESAESGRAQEAVAKRKEDEEKSLEASRATDADIAVPKPDGLDYMPFQKAGIAFGLAKEGVLIADEMGLGKTIQAIGIINATPDAKRILVICPASLKLNWAKELKRWLVQDLSIRIINGANGFGFGNIAIINYDILTKNPALLSEEWDLLIVDEAHYLKNPDAKRTQAVFGRPEVKRGKNPQEAVPPIRAKRRVFLTGTPVVNRPVESWGLIHSLAPAEFPNFWNYAKRYCDAKQTRFGWDFSGASNLEELQVKLRKTIMVRRLKRDVLTELPPKSRSVIEIPCDDPEVIYAEQSVYATKEKAIEDARLRVELAKASDDPEVYKAAVAALRESIAVAFNEMSDARHRTALYKMDEVAAFVEDSIESGPVVVFAHHRDVIDSLHDRFKDKAVKLYGGMSNEQKDKAVTDFQEGRADIFIGQIQAAGVGLTLTRSSHVVFAELDWVPGNMSQAEDRCHRIGQRDNVTVHHIVLEGSLDAHMAKTLVQKQDVIDRMLDTTVKLDPVEIDTPVVPRDEPSTSSVRRLAIDRIAPTLDSEDVLTIHACLQQLAGLDEDFAQGKNDVGFAKPDVRLGHDLAERTSLTPRQAALGLMLCQKYNKTQLGGVLDRFFAFDAKANTGE